MRRQFFELRVGQTLSIGDSRVTLEQKSGQRARLRVESLAPTALQRNDDSALQRPAGAAEKSAAPAAATPFMAMPKLA